MLNKKQFIKRSLHFVLSANLVFYSLAPAFSTPVFASEKALENNQNLVISESLSNVQPVDKPIDIEPAPEPELQPIDIGQIKPIEIIPEEILTPENKLPAEDANRDGEEPEPYIQKDEIKSLTDKLNINTDTNTGAFNYTYPIEIPAGRNNLQPDLVLSYNNQDTNNQNLFGYGWSLNIPSIERLNKTGIDNLYTDNYFISSLGGELAAISLSDDVHGTYGPRVENGDFLKYEYTTSSTWLITDKLGTVYTFGYSTSTRQDDPTDNTKIYKWMLSEVRDTNDNFIRYQYYKDAGQIYPEKIFYTGHTQTDGIFEVEFVREERSDNLSSFQTGFQVTNNYRISQILIKINNQWQKKYYLNYETGDNGNRSLLSGIQQAAPSQEQGLEAAMPEEGFDYYSSTTAWNLDSSYTFPTIFLSGRSDRGVRLFDVNGDSLVDIIEPNNNTEWDSYVYINDGHGNWNLDSSYTFPVRFISSVGGIDYGVRLSDLNGDGLLDVIEAHYNEANEKRVFINNGDGTWSLDNNYVFPLFFTTGRYDNGVRLVDVNGDGFDDVIATTGADDPRYVYINDGSKGFLSNISSGEKNININYQSSAQYTEPGSQVSMSAERDAEVLMPEEEFIYQKNENPGWSQDSNWQLPQFSVDSRVISVADLNGDAYADIFYNYGPGGNSWARKTFINNQDGTWVDDPNCLPPITPLLDRRDYLILDVNGDNLNDISSPSGLFLNNGDCTWGGQTYNMPPLGAPNNNVLSWDGTQHYFYIDMNGDSLQDIVHIYTWTNTRDIYINGGQDIGFYLDTENTFPEYSQTLYNANALVLDVNADGFDDILHWEYLWINNGDFTFSLNTPLSLPNLVTSGTRFADINSDGLVDVLRSVSGALGFNEVFLNNSDTGYYFDSDYSIPIYFGHRPDLYISEAPGTFVADINGDGAGDLIDFWGDHRLLYLNNLNKTDHLINISDNVSQNINLTYQASSQSRDANDELANPKLPYIIQTVKQINVFDGLATTTIDYNYSGGEQYFDSEHPRDKKFAGFSLVAKTIGDKTTKTYYQQANETNSDNGESADTYAKIGKVYRQEVYDAEDLKSASIHKWQETDLNNNRAFVYSPEKSNIDFASSTVAFATQSDYDLTNGNLLSENNLGQVELNTNTGEILDTLVGDEKNTTYDYAANTTKHILSAPKEKVITDNADTKSQELYYDDLAFGQVNKVNLTKEDYVIDNVEINRDFNDLGLVISETDPENNTVNLLYDEYNLYPSEKTNALNQTTYTIYNLLNGQVATSTAENGAVTVNSFDAFGRLVKTEISSASSTTELLTKQEIVYQDFEFPRYKETRDYFDVNQYKISREYYDGLDRVIQTKTQTASSTQWSTQDIAYDTQGRVASQSLPYISQNIDYSTPDLNQAVKNYTYDALDRVLTENTPVGTTTYEYNGLTTTIYDANNKRKDLIKDAYGNLVEVKEYNGQDVYTTSYEYSLTNKLTKITDALGNIRNFVYDDLDNLVSQDMIHRPNAQNIPTITYTYDKNGNILTETNFNNQTITYTYDDLNRVLTESVNASPKISYIYDQGINNVGKLTRVNYLHNGNWQTYNYNFLNQLTDYDVRINNDAYALNYAYNLNNALKQIDYPNSKTANYTFNNIGQVSSVSVAISTIASNLQYNVNGQLVHLERANGLITDYTYTPEQAYRLTNLSTTNATSTLQNISYTYDAVGNILSITDDANTNLAKTANYSYDDLNRLVSSTVSYVNIPSSNYTQNFSYDAIGNILTNSALGTYSYTLANPQQLSSIPNQNFTYDNAGNLLTDSQKTLTWDWRSRMTKSQNNGTSDYTSYEYDSQNQRLLKTTKRPTVVILPLGKSMTNLSLTKPPVEIGEDIILTEEHYVDQYFERNDKNNDTKDHIFINGQKVATINNNNAPYYIISDHLNSSSLLVDNAGNIAEVSDYKPFGNQAYNHTITNLKNDYNFTGKETDEESTLQYFGARYMDNNIGRFVSVDPVSLNLHDENKLKELSNQQLQFILSNPQLLNNYSYSANNPIVYTDSDGNFLDTFLDIGFIAYDLYKIGSNIAKGQSVKAEFGNLGLDVVGTLIPGVTGLGMVGRIANKADDVVDVVKVVKSADNVNDASKYIDNVDDLIPQARQNHILNGDVKGGGHKFGAGKGKPEFPSSWSDKQIFHNATDIATDPSLKWSQQRDGRWFVSGIRDNVNMKVIIDRTKSHIINAFPKIK